MVTIDLTSVDDGFGIDVACLYQREFAATLTHSDCNVAFERTIERNSVKKTQCGEKSVTKEFSVMFCDFCVRYLLSLLIKPRFIQFGSFNLTNNTTAIHNKFT